MIQRTLWDRLTGKNPETVGEVRRDQGMAKVEANTGEWKQEVQDAARFWITKKRSGEAFTTEDIKNWLMEWRGVAEPHHPNAWSAALGGLCKKLLREGKIGNYGFTTAKNPRANARAIRQYFKI